MIIKKQIVNHQLILAISDDDLIGKKFEENDLQLDLSSSFYRGSSYDEGSAKVLTAKASMINVVRKKSITFCSSLGLIEGGRVIVIKGIPHIQILVQR